jgi:hypothetical protein
MLAKIIPEMDWYAGHACNAREHPAPKPEHLVFGDDFTK